MRSALAAIFVIGVILWLIRLFGEMLSWRDIKQVLRDFGRSLGDYRDRLGRAKQWRKPKRK